MPLQIQKLRPVAFLQKKYATTQLSGTFHWTTTSNPEVRSFVTLNRGGTGFHL